MARCVITIPADPAAPFRINWSHHVNFGYWFDNHLTSEFTRKHVPDPDRILPGESEGLVYLVNRDKLGPILKLAQEHFGLGLTIIGDPGIEFIQAAATPGSKKPVPKVLSAPPPDEDSGQMSLF